MSEQKNLNARSMSVSESLQQVLTGDDNNHYTGADGVYEKHLPETLNMGIIKEVNDYTRDFTAGSIHAVGTIGSKVVGTSDGKIKGVTATIKTGAGERLEVAYTGKKEGKIPGKDTTYEKFGSTSVSHFTSAGGKGGEIGVALDLVQQMSEVALKK